jgi:hypothetical protein
LDIQRSEYLNNMGYRVFRFWNNQVLQENEAVLETILAILMNEKRNSPSPQPSPPSEERGFIDLWPFEEQTVSCTVIP